MKHIRLIQNKQKAIKILATSTRKKANLFGYCKNIDYNRSMAEKFIERTN